MWSLVRRCCPHRGAAVLITTEASPGADAAAGTFMQRPAAQGTETGACEGGGNTPKSATGGSVPMPLAFSVTETVLYVATTAWLAVRFDELASVFDLFGALCGSMEILIVPGILWWHFGGTILQPQHRWMRGAGTVLLVGSGVVVLVSGTIVSIQSVASQFAGRS